MLSTKAVLVFQCAFYLLLLLPGQNAIAVPQTSDEEDRDEYSMTLVKTLLEQPEGFSVSWLEKRQGRLGDRAAIALLKLFTEQELLEPRRLIRSLSVMRGAFSTPCYIEIVADKKPSVTLFVLRGLERQVKDANVSKQIVETISSVQQNTSASCDGGKPGKPNSGL